MPRLFRILPLLLLISLAAWAHTYHTSLMEVRFNPEKQRLEIALKVFTDDLEAALSQGQPAPHVIDRLSRAQLDPLLLSLLRREVQLSTKAGRLLPLTLVGLQKETDSHWLFFTAPLPANATGVMLRQRLLLTIFPDQMNLVNLSAGKQKESFLFRNGHEEQELSW
ncbi:DUF6702 family protein [Hymenobacter psychrophilus]|uniref:Uncharacterized protein n=1 Tax=Hymenobacter psychrophilus TaxID=651662 RepID=A0A1H3H3N8_9BACT|nr:DUF6702 family protein [Hymenobacter psychrophilus]SDY09249.1 hypothetical protein SAMN04488069_105255 [Hymenobacter psychrophilus]